MNQQDSENLNVTEIFYSLQGEGPLTGAPAIFVRLAACNLSCSWCDSKFTWQKDIFESISMTFKEVKEEIFKYLDNKNQTLLIFTGGEPLLQQDKILAFLAYIEYAPINKQPDIRLCFETNGTITPLQEIIELEPLIVISLKIHKRAWAYHNIWWDKLIPVERECLTFKFVIEDHGIPGNVTDLQLVDEFLRRFPMIARYQIFIMPEGITPEAINEKLPSLFEYAKRNKVNVSTRLQILAYGNKRAT